jgi:hypothetical protein
MSLEMKKARRESRSASLLCGKADCSQQRRSNDKFISNPSKFTKKPVMSKDAYSHQSNGSGEQEPVNYGREFRLMEIPKSII